MQMMGGMGAMGAQYPGQNAGVGTGVAAIRNFDATEPRMVSAKYGDMIEVLQLHPSGWSYVKNLSQSFLVISC